MSRVGMTRLSSSLGSISLFSLTCRCPGSDLSLAALAPRQAQATDIFLGAQKRRLLRIAGRPRAMRSCAAEC